MTTQGNWRWAWVGLTAGLLAAVVVFAPAQWLAAALKNLSDGRLQLINPRGTVWRGQGDLMLSGGAGSRGQTALPQGIRWRLWPGWSQSPVLRVRLVSPCCTDQPVSMALRPGLGSLQLRLDAFSSQWPAAMLVGLGTPWNTLRLDGQLLLRSPGFSVAWHRGRLRLKGQVNIEAHEVATRVSTLRPLGSYRVEVLAEEDGDRARLTLGTLRGGLLLQGSGQWVGGRLRFRGDARAAPGNENALANLLSIIGRRDGTRSVLTFG